MTTDIGKGDVVVAVYNMKQHGVLAGDRDIVAQVVDGIGICRHCAQAKTRGLILEKHPLTQRGAWAWCLCGWRKVGGSQADTVALFAPYLVNRPALLPHRQTIIGEYVYRAPPPMIAPQAQRIAAARKRPRATRSA